MRSTGTPKLVRSSPAPETEFVCVCLVLIVSWKKVGKVRLQGDLASSSKSMANLTYTDLMFEGQCKVRATWVLELPVGRRS